MSNYNDEKSYYEPYVENNGQSSIVRTILIVLGLALIAVLIFLLMRSCGGTKLEPELLKSAKEYYNKNVSFTPSIAGECSIVTLNQLSSENLIKLNKKYDVCDKTSTYVQVCKLESGKLHYTPIIFCTANHPENTNFFDWAIGRESNLIIDKSNLRFSFMPEVYSSKTKLYYPGDKKDPKDIKEYYVTSPASDYIYKDSETKNVSKWYTDSTATVYWNNGGYASEAPSGFPNRGNEGTAVKKTSENRPEDKSYRTITTSTLYRAKDGKPYVYQYECLFPGTSAVVTSNTLCETRTECPKGIKCTTGMKYTCDGTNPALQTATCGWSSVACVDASKCETKTGYTYTDKVWQWSTTTAVRKYIPSGASYADQEKTYYLNSPVDGAKKDTTTTTTAYKYYKLIEGKDSNGSEGDWNQAGSIYVTEFELIGQFRSLGYEVNSLKDIYSMDEIKYSIRLEYAHRK